jgi:hypothetical protein
MAPKQRILQLIERQRGLMACSLPAGLWTKAVACATLIAAALLASVALHAQDANRYILATRRSGAIEIIDPESLATLGRIHFDLPSESVGLNGVSASADGTILYVEGPIPNMPNGCCVLYSIDLATLQTKQVAGIGGTASRGRFITSNGIAYQVAPPSGSETRAPSGAVDFYDPAQGKFVRYLAPSGLSQGWWRNGIRVDDQFVFYASKDDGSAARLWSISPHGTPVSVPVESFADVPGCSSSAETGLAASSGNLFLYEMFGWKLDRRTNCLGVPGGAWIVYPSSGSLLTHVAPDLYFSELIADREKGELYGLSVGDPGWGSGVELVRMDAQNGTILRSRVLESDYWRIAVVPLRGIPAGDVRALISAKK